MTTIHIPPASLESGCSAYTAVIYRGNGTQAEFREAIRAAFVAMVEAWPGMKLTPWWEFTTHKKRVDLVLPLPEKADG